MTDTPTIDSSIVYTATVDVTGGRGGSARSRTGELNLELARPATRGKGEGTDPEELFAAGYAACFDSALTVASHREHAKTGLTTTTASVSLAVTPDKCYSLIVHLDVRAPECDTAELKRLVAIADTLCPYSNGMRGNVPVTITARGRD